MTVGPLSGCGAEACSHMGDGSPWKGVNIPGQVVGKGWIQRQGVASRGSWAERGGSLVQSVRNYDDKIHNDC